MQTHPPGPYDESPWVRPGARMSAEQKPLLQQAATLSARTQGEIIVASTQEAAPRIVQASEPVRLSRAEQVAFVSALLDPPAPNARLREAAVAYRSTSA